MEMLNSRSVNEMVLQRKFKYKKDTLQLYDALGYASVDLALVKIPQRVAFSAFEKRGDHHPGGNAEPAIGRRRGQCVCGGRWIRSIGKKAVSRARNSRVYIESQLSETLGRLNQATRDLADFQRQNPGGGAGGEQTKSAMERAGEVKGQMIAKEVQLGIMRQTMKPANPLIEKAQREFAELQRLYDRMQFGDVKKTQDYDLAFDQVPDLGIHLAALLREVKIQETVLYALLNQQFYQARIEEARDTPPPSRCWILRSRRPFAVRPIVKCCC